MKLTYSLLLAAAIAASSTDAFLPGPSLAGHKATANSSIMARSENSKRTSDRNRGNRGGPQEYGNDYGGYGGGQEFDYSGGNLKYGTGKYTQQNNDGYQGGVNMSQNGRSMQDNVYRQDRENVDRARGRPRNDFGSRMDEIEDLERGMGGGGRPLRDRMMENRGRGGGGMMRDANDYEMDGFSGGGIRDRMGGGGLLRDHQGIQDRHDTFDDFGAPPTIMGGSSKRRHGGYRSRQFENGLSNERRRYEEYGHRMDEYDLDGRGDFIDDRRRGGGRGGPSNFDRMMGRDGFDRMESRMESRDMMRRDMMDGDMMDGDMDDRYYGRDEGGYRSGSRGMGGGNAGMMDGSRGRSNRVGRGEYYDGDNFEDGRGDGRLLRDHRR